MSELQSQLLKTPFNRKVPWLIAGVCAVDELTKWWARGHLISHATHVLGPLWWRLRYNPGIAFSFSSAAPAVATSVELVVLAVALWISLVARPGWPAVGFGLFTGGGVGNLLDRLTNGHHAVTDFVSVGAFPIFNVADAAITVGVVIILLVTARGQRLWGERA